MNQKGFTLVEMSISLFILAMICLALGVATIMARKLSEAAVYQGLALSTATGYLEQIKSMDYQSLLDACNNPATKPLPTRINDGTDDVLYINAANDKTVVLNQDLNGNTLKTYKVRITPTLTNLLASTALDAMEVQLTYEWSAPGAQTSLKRALRAVRSRIPTY